MNLKLEPEPNESNPNPPASPDGESTDRFEAEAARIPEVIAADDAGAAAGAAAQPVDAAGWPDPIIRGLFSLPTSYVARRAGEYWKLTDGELDMLVLTAKPVLDKWLPFDTLGEVGALVAVLTVVLGPRLAQLHLDRAATPSTATRASAA